MLRFSSSYVYARSSFVLIGCEEENRCEESVYSLLCVAQNLLQRGTPTNPSNLMRERLGELPSVSDEYRIASDAIAASWDMTIGGSKELGFNPAREFYENLLPSMLPEEMRYVMGCILPEARISDIVEDCPEEFVDQRVDFYCDRTKTVIEVDGSQHATAQQRMLDARRDELLSSEGIGIVRISTIDIIQKSKALSEAVAQLIASLERDAAPLHWKRVQAFSESQAVARYELMMRIQIALIEAMKHGMVDLRANEVHVSLKTDVLWEEGAALLQAAYDDICQVVVSLFKLLGEPFTAPALLMVRGEGSLELDVAMGATWSDNETKKGAAGTLYVRSDYYASRDCFEVAIANPIRYRTEDMQNEGEVEEALRFFLHYLFGYDDFNPGQLGIIKKALTREATLGILPTGSGKSICYQISALLQPCISFVVCPIVSLIQDQKNNLDAFSITRTARIDGSMEPEEKHRALSEFGRGRYFFIWISPERFQIQDFRNQLSRIGRDRRFGYAVIDEVHCLSEWGHDFRVSYLKLPSTIRDYCAGAVLLGLTATASRNVFEDLKAELRVTRNNVQTVAEIDRPELHYHILKTTNRNRLDTLCDVLREVNEKYEPTPSRPSIFVPAGEDSICGIIFSSTKKSKESRNTSGCENIKERLASEGIASDTYHADRKEERALIQQSYLDNRFTVMVATKSFGMGVNKKNVRYTIHASLPWSIESFYQEAGRAGRDRKNNESDCYVLYVPDADEERTEMLFSRQSSVDEVHALQPELEGDLSTLFFLWTRSNDTPDNEVARILSVFCRLREACTGDGEAVIGAHKGEHTEEALYKLAILGIVIDWTVDYRGHSYTVSLRDITEDSEALVKESVEAYISRHGGAFSFDNPKGDHAKYARIYEEAPTGRKLPALIRALVEWTNDHIIWSRRAAIGNMLKLCESNRSEEEIREYINGFFRLDTPDNDILDRIVHSQVDLGLWESVLYENVKSDDPFEQKVRLRDELDLRDVSAMCDQYKESYHNSLGLEWVSMMSGLIGRAHGHDVTIDQLRFIAREAEVLIPGGYRALHARILSILQATSEEVRDAFGRMIVQAFPELAAETYKKTGDYVTLEHLVSTGSRVLKSRWKE